MGQFHNRHRIDTQVTHHLENRLIGRLSELPWGVC